MTAHDEVREALVVAGGRGTRLQPLTFGVPKPLLPFCGQPFLAGVLQRLARAGVRRTWLIVGADSTPFRELQDVVDMDLEVVPEPTPLDTAGGVRAVAAQLDGTVLVLNGDVLTDVDLAAAVSHHRAHRPAATIVLTRVDDTSSFGVCVREGSRIVDFVEKPPPGTLPGQDTVNAGTYVLEPEVLMAHPEGPLSFERDVFPGVLANGGTLEGVVWNGVWSDLGTPDRWLEGTRLALAGDLDWPTLDRMEVTGDRVLADAASVADDAVVRGPVGLDGANVASGATVGPNTFLGARVGIGAAAVVTDSVVMEGSEIGDGVVLDRVIVGRNSRIDAGALIGRGAVLGHEQHVVAGDVLAPDERRPPRTD
ncbi:MAG: NDP-sugar synthase [Nitriliruptorales bacterium]|nr:NDP-sugar synthase [Nitriliruptorales bacterium]